MRKNGSTVFNGTSFLKHKGHDGHKGRARRIQSLFFLSGAPALSQTPMKRSSQHADVILAYDHETPRLNHAAPERGGMIKKPRSKPIDDSRAGVFDMPAHGGLRPGSITVLQMQDDLIVLAGVGNIRVDG